MKPLKLGFIGGGINSSIGRTHRISCEMDGLFELHAGAFSRNSDINRQSAVEYGVPENKVYTDWQELLKSESKNLDAVVIITPTPQHLDAVLECLKLGVPVLCEKALASNFDEIEKIYHALIQSNGFLSVFYNYSGYPVIRELRERVVSGELGQITNVHIEMPQEGFIKQNSKTNSVALPQSWRQADADIPTVSLDLGVHVHQMVTFLTGLRPVSVIGEQRTFGKVPNVVDHVNAIINYEDGMLCNTWYGKSALGERNGLKVRIYGELGSAYWAQSQPEVLTLTNQFGERTILDRGHDGHQILNDDRYNRFRAGHPSGFIEAFANFYSDLARALHNHFGNAEAQPFNSAHIPTVVDALCDIDLIESTHKSAQERRWVNVTRFRDIAGIGGLKSASSE